MDQTTLEQLLGTLDQTTLVQHTEIAGAIIEELRRLGYMADLLPYSDSGRKSLILMVISPNEPKTIFHVEIWKVQDREEKKDLVER